MAIRKASRDYNSDYMSRLCDDELEQLEERLTALYANATNDVLSDYKKWMSHYKANYNEMCAKLEAGEISQKDFKEWVDRRMIDDKLFTETVNSMTDILVNTDLVAMALVNDELPLIIAQSYNFVQSLGFAAADEAGLSVGTFQVYNARTVQALIKDNPDILKYVNKKEDYKWNKDRLNNEITHSILSGDSIQKTALRIQNVTSMDENAAIRTARTGMTAAENLGRNEGYHDIKEKGVPCRFQWSATHDNRTRDTHILLDGTYQDDDGLFGVGIIDTPIEYPGDPAGDPEEIYNCRCRASLRLEGVDHSQDDELYEQFMKENFPDDWESVKEARDKNEKKFQEKASGAAERVEKRRESKADNAEEQKAKEPQEKPEIPESVRKDYDKFEDKYIDAKVEHGMLYDKNGELISESSSKRGTSVNIASESTYEQLGEGSFEIHNHTADELFSWKDISNYEKYGINGTITTPAGYEYTLFNFNEPRWDWDDTKRMEQEWLATAWHKAQEEINDEWIMERRSYLDSISDLARDEQRKLLREWEQTNDRISRQEKWLEDNAENYGFIFEKKKVK